MSKDKPEVGDVYKELETKANISDLFKTENE